MKNNLTGIQKIALLIRTVGYDSITPVIRNLQLPEDVLTQIDKETPQTVSKNVGIDLLREFNTSVNLVVGGKRESIMDALDDIGMENDAFGKISRKMNGFKKLSSMSAEEVCALIRQEQPLHQAIILFELPEKLSVEIFNLFDIEAQAKITQEADQAESPKRETLMAINAVIEDIVQNSENHSSGNLERILSFTDGMEEEHLNTYLACLPSDIADKIRANVLTFTHVTLQSEAVLSDILSDLATGDIAYAFCLCAEEEMNKMKAALTSTKAQDVTFNIDKTVNKEDRKKISEAQRTVIMRAKRLQSDGTIEIVR
ncbi:FliG C-terminal domain-containing protein [Photobacterium galatheae]|uniref:Flagellar motor switch protein FliG C-terminal domain-containing protein n=1 Tax=Photobacterium galatheae TaxID=1654360 RepID=A0A066RK94_9GAMM|nr:FliG C-terminal domain-containing protein [Photobacterium galatheae]KDM90865.1 hypothetical protein EA58_13980 [Photobacterium galatheae]MCM0149167.1 hypothetical protein [Photobacterium galatheae]